MGRGRCSNVSKKIAIVRQLVDCVFFYCGKVAHLFAVAGREGWSGCCAPGNEGRGSWDSLLARMQAGISVGSRWVERSGVGWGVAKGSGKVQVVNAPQRPCGTGCVLPGVLLNLTSLIPCCCMTAPILSGPINNNRAAVDRAVLYTPEKQKGEVAGQCSTKRWGIVASGCEPWKGGSAGHLAPTCVGDAAFVVGRAGVNGWLRGNISSGTASTSCPAPRLPPPGQFLQTLLGSASNDSASALLHLLLLLQPSVALRTGIHILPGWLRTGRVWVDDCWAADRGLWLLAAVLRVLPHGSAVLPTSTDPQQTVKPALCKDGEGRARVRSGPRQRLARSKLLNMLPGLSFHLNGNAEW